MPPRLARRALLALLMLSAFAARPAAQTPVAPESQPTGAGLAPLWIDALPPSRMHRIPTAARAPLAPFVTSDLPEDAAWEGFVTPASNGSSALFIEYHGKLVLANGGMAGSVVSPYLSTWDGTKFEPLPALGGDATALGIWSDQLVVATEDFRASPARFEILKLDGAQWDTLGTPNSYVYKLCEYLGHLIAGGQFAFVNGVSAPVVAAFDGSAWSQAGSGLSSGQVYGLTVHAGKLVACGSLSPLRGVASLDALGSTWQTLGTGLDLVRDVLSDGVDLYASGRLIVPPSTPLGGLARWNGAAWVGLGAPTNWGVTDVYLTRWNNRIVINMPASTAPGSIGRFAQWDGVTLSSLPGDSVGPGIAFNVGTWGNELVGTGSFNLNGSTIVPRVVTYDGAQWGSISEAWKLGMTGPTLGFITDMLAWGGKLIITGALNLFADQDHWTLIGGIAGWDGAHWTPLGGGLGGQYLVLGTFAGDLIATGNLLNVRGLPITNVARWNGTSWSGLGTGAPSDGSSIADFQGQLHVGSFDFPGGISRWNGSAWSSVPGLDGQDVEALGVAGSRLVVGGYFAQAGAVVSPNVVFWDGTSFEAAGVGVNGYVYTVASWLGQPVIGGAFTASGATPLPGVAIWDGAAWQPMGTRAVEVDRMRVIDGELFASGEFRLPDDTVAETIAHWTGSDWHVLGSGGSGYAFDAYDGYLYQQGTGLVHGHGSHNLSRVPLGAVLGVPRPGTQATSVSLTVLSNPARGRARFSFALPTAGHARLTIHDVAGRMLATPEDDVLGAGAHVGEWAASAAPGVYFARLQAGTTRVIRRFVLLGP